MTNGRGKNVASLRNLPQYRGKTDAEILELISTKSFDARIQERLGSLAEHYDLSDMKYNDIQSLYTWAVLTERLQTEELALIEAKENGEISPQDALREEQRLSIMRKDALNIQEALNITRAKRRDKVEDNPRLLFDDIRERAAKFYKERLAYLQCPNCGMNLVTVNFSYPELDNEIHLTCGKCNKRCSFTSKEAIEIERTNPYK